MSKLFARITFWRRDLARFVKSGQKQGFGKSLFISLLLALFLTASPGNCAEPAPLISAWNRACKSLRAPQKFYLVGERAASPQAAIRAITNFCAIFQQKKETSCGEEIKALGREMAKSAFLVYADFRNEHWQDTAIILSPRMTARDLAKTLNAYLKIGENGRIPDYVSRETVATVIWMNSFCAFFEDNLAKMHRQGIDSGINSCKRLSTQGKYPCLDGWLE